MLTPKRRVNILRDVMDAKAQSRPYVIVFCGVNGVGKSTNLAKVSSNILILLEETFLLGRLDVLDNF